MTLPCRCRWPTFRSSHSRQARIRIILSQCERFLRQSEALKRSRSLQQANVHLANAFICMGKLAKNYSISFFFSFAKSICTLIIYLMDKLFATNKLFDDINCLFIFTKLRSRGRPSPQKDQIAAGNFPHGFLNKSVQWRKFLH